MIKNSVFDFFCGSESVQFAFFKMPRQLFTNPNFKNLSTDAKLLYGILLDRMCLSAKNGWHDDSGRGYIYYTVREVCETIACGRNKAMRLLAELDTVKGIGLIERVKQGQGKPDKIFVKRISTQENSEKDCLTEPSTSASISEVDFSDVQKSEIPTSRGRENRLLEVSKADPNKTKKNQTEFIKIYLSILPHVLQRPPGADRIDRYENTRELNREFERRVIYAPLLCCLLLSRTSCTENLPPGYRAQASAVIGAGVASMSFGSTNDPC